MKYLTKRTFRIFWDHAKKYKISGSITFIFSIGAALSALVAPYYYSKLFDLIALGGTREAAVSLVVIIFIVNILHNLNWRILLFATAYFEVHTARDIALSCFRYIHNHSFQFFQNNFVGSLVKKVNRFGSSFQGILDIIIFDFIQIIVTLIAIIVILGIKSPIMAVVITFWAILFTLINYFFSKYKLKYDVRRTREESEATGVLADTITNHTNVKLFVAQKREFKKYKEVMDRLTKTRKFTWDLGNWFEVVQAIITLSVEFIIFYVAIDLWKSGILSVGEFALIHIYILRIFYKLWFFGRIIRNLYERLADAEEMTEIFETPHEIVDHKHAKELAVNKGKIEFDTVNFAYHKTRKIMKNFSLTISPAERVALVGPSGAGKSTIVKLLLRQHDISRGQIRIDGQRIDRVTQESLWSAISLVPQDPILFHRTLMENIRYGKPNATDEEVIAAAKAAHCHEFISQFPEGYETYVGERGVKLSGGERQRVAIARAILRNAPILILDEATASLDSESEMFIQDALDTLMKNKTVIVVAHRLSTIMKSDRILVVDEGNIVEQGSHDQLLKKKDGQYKKLWQLQAGGFLT